LTSSLVVFAVLVVGIHEVSVKCDTNFAAVLGLEVTTPHVDDGAVGNEQSVPDNPRLGARVAYGVLFAVGGVAGSVDADAVA